MQKQPHEPLAMLNYRMEVIEREINNIKTQLSLYEPSRENNLKLERINDTASRVADELGTIKEKIETMNTSILTQENALDKLQVRVLVSILSTIVVVVTALFVFYVTHGH